MYPRKWRRAEFGPPEGLAGEIHPPMTIRQIDTAAVGSSGGTGYNVGDTMEPDGSTGINAVLTVATVASGPPGPIATVTITSAGYFIDDPTPLTDNPVNTLTGTGSGALLDFTMADN